MAKLIIRFYGRFISTVEMSDGAPTGTIRLLAPRFGAKFRPHKTVLSVATVHVDSDETTLDPTMMVSAPQAIEGARAETLLWDLNDCEITLPAALSPATLGVSAHSPDFPLVDLDNMLQRMDKPTAVLKETARSVGDETQAVVVVNQGRGVVHRLLRPDVSKGISRRKLGDEALLVTLADTRDAEGPDNDKPVTEEEVGMGEVIDFEIDLMTLEPFAFEVTGKKTGRIAVRAMLDDMVVTASFSSLCATLPRNEHYDLEFEQYYDVLTPDTHPGDDALIPKATDDGGEPASCQRMTKIQIDATTLAAVR